MLAIKLTQKAKTHMSKELRLDGATNTEICRYFGLEWKKVEQMFNNRYTGDQKQAVTNRHLGWLNSLGIYITTTPDNHIGFLCGAPVALPSDVTTEEYWK